ncbi:MAG: HK97 family phage prohead protease [Candidatus Nealsonbacteria bacterium]
MELIKKQLDIKVKEFNEEEGTIRAILASGMPDRQGDMIDNSSWNFDDYKKNPVVLWAHDHTQPAIAQALEIGINSDGMLEAVVKFAVEEYEFAKTVFKLISGKFMRAFSVGFFSNKIEEINDIRILRDNILYEFSVVNVGADALALAKTKGIDVSSIEKMEEKRDIEKPYPTEHSCRLEDPGKYKKFRRDNCAAKHDGKCIDYIYGILSPKKSELQAMRYDKEIWTEANAKSHCKDNDGTFEPASEKEHKVRLEKEGRVLSAKNRGVIEKAKGALEDVLRADEDSRADKKKSRIAINQTNYKRVLSKAIRELIEARNI